MFSELSSRADGHFTALEACTCTCTTKELEHELYLIASSLFLHMLVALIKQASKVNSDCDCLRSVNATNSHQCGLMWIECAFGQTGFKPVWIQFAVWTRLKSPYIKVLQFPPTVQLCCAFDWLYNAVDRKNECKVSILCCGDASPVCDDWGRVPSSEMEPIFVRAVWRA